MADPVVEGAVPTAQVKAAQLSTARSVLASLLSSDFVADMRARGQASPTVVAVVGAHSKQTCTIQRDALRRHLGARRVIAHSGQVSPRASSAHVSPCAALAWAACPPPRAL